MANSRKFMNTNCFLLLANRSEGKTGKLATEAGAVATKPHNRLCPHSGDEEEKCKGSATTARL